MLKSKSINLAAILAAPALESLSIVNKFTSFIELDLSPRMKPSLIRCQLLKTLPVHTIGRPSLVFNSFLSIFGYIAAT